MNALPEDSPGPRLCPACQPPRVEVMKHVLEMGLAANAVEIVVPGYRIERELGRGGMGIVYLVRNEATGETLALKVLRHQVTARQRAAQLMFEREIENTKALRHPHVVELRESDFLPNHWYFTMEYCDGGSLDALCKQHGPLPVKEAAEITLQVLSGLEYAHQATIPHVRRKDGTDGPGRGLVHRDLKPHNIFLTTVGGKRVAKIGDFGLAKAFESAGESGLTISGVIGGTPEFMARAAGHRLQACRAGGGRLGRRRDILLSADRSSPARFSAEVQSHRGGGDDRAGAAVQAQPRAAEGTGRRHRPGTDGRSGPDLQIGGGVPDGTGARLVSICIAATPLTERRGRDTIVPLTDAASSRVAPMRSTARRKKTWLIVALALPVVLFGLHAVYGQRPGQNPIPRPNPNPQPFIPNPNPQPFIPPPPIQPQVPMFVTVWSCSRCGAELGRGDVKPSVEVCPRCGARLGVGGMFSGSGPTNARGSGNPEAYKTGAIILGVVVLGAALLVGGGLLLARMLRSRPDDEDLDRRRSAAAPAMTTNTTVTAVIEADAVVVRSV